MRLSDLARKAAALPDIEFEWPGAEHWHDDVFQREVKTVEDAKAYIDAMRKRMADYSFALAELVEAYRALRDAILAAEVD